LFPVILVTRAFSSNKVIVRADKFVTKLPYKTKPDWRSPMRNRNFAGTPSPSVTNINYEQLKKFIVENKASIIDVRNKDELAATGVIPNSHNIPLDELSAAFQLTPEEFLNKYNFAKPNKELDVVFSCAKGIRSLKASQYLVDLGYKNVFNYTEGWFGWESQNK